MTGNSSSSPAPCQFCGRPPARGQHRISGPQGPICAECIETGLRLTATRKPVAAEEGDTLVRLARDEDGTCELCERDVRLSFLGFRKPLVRARSTASGSVICAECLDWGGNLINRAIRG